MAPRTSPRSRTRGDDPPADARPLTFQGETAFYSPREMEVMVELGRLPGDEGEVWGRFIHAAKVHLDASLVE